MIYSLFRFVNKGQKWVKKSVILGVNGLNMKYTDMIYVYFRAEEKTVKIKITDLTIFSYLNYELLIVLIL